ncbi:c-type cytochrome [Heliorestis convoluta]|uniref:18 kDa cytochrome c553, PetJ n=1 Tax=Heliorestis convoluta TaxID=356322 RepID=A0A5Q2N5V3_9FIRM|nr:cytochrome c [Heliorestis convoluta]QGG48722.1 18 kDa cytochrome c553, PetJ [Heliorestis convoluta]
MKKLQLIGLTGILGLSMVALTACGGSTPAPAPQDEEEVIEVPAEEEAAEETAEEAEEAAEEAAEEGASQVSAADLEKGKALYMGRAACIACHKLGDEGLVEIGPNLGDTGSKFTSEELVQIMIDPSGMGLDASMPPAPMLNDEEKKLVADFLASLK